LLLLRTSSSLFTSISILSSPITDRVTIIVSTYNKGVVMTIVIFIAIAIVIVAVVIE